MSRLTELGEKALSLLKQADWIALLVARLTVGILFVSTGWGKVHNLDKVTAFFGDDLHIPMPRFNATLASYSELICGTLLVVGVASRLAAIPLVVTMIVALLTAKAKEIHGLPDLFGEVEWTYLAILVMIVFVGPGAASVDALLKRRFFPPRPSRASPTSPASPGATSAA